MWKRVVRGQRRATAPTGRQSSFRRVGRTFERLEHRALLAGTASGDFNGDGFADLAAAAPRDTVSGKVSAGSISVIYGSPNGLTAAGNQLWTMDTPGVNGVAAASDFFGNSLAVGDFNGDGFDDLAIGSPARTVNGQIAAGAVNILFGSESGLSAVGDQQFTQDSDGLAGTAEAFDSFGGALAAGDFDADGFEDLAIGASAEDDSRGVVAVFYGGDDGLTTERNQLWTQDSPGIDGHSEILESFGQTLAAGDFNGDGRCDLAVGTTADHVGSAIFAGAVNVIYGTSTGLKATGDQLLNQGLPDVAGGVEANERWGQSLAVGDFDRDGFDDLAVGTGRATVSGIANAGEFNVFYGSDEKPQTTGSQRFTPGSFGIPLSENLAFASTLAAGDFNGRDDLAIGIIGYDIPGEALGRPLPRRRRRSRRGSKSRRRVRGRTDHGRLQRRRPG
jgi:hypothetical protein